MNDEELKSLVTSGVKTMNGRCEFELCNKTLPELGVTILEAGVKFFYRDGTDDTDGPRSVNLSTNNCTTFYSQEPTKCVHQVYLVVRVHANGESNDATYDYRDNAPAGECFLTLGATLGPKTSVKEHEIKSLGWQTLIKLSKTTA